MHGFGEIRPGPIDRERVQDLPGVKVIPYDYLAKFQLTGNVGNLVQDVISISAEGVFVAISMGYGFDEERAVDLLLDAPVTTLGDVTLSHFPPDVLIEGVRLNPALTALALTRNGQLNANLSLGDVRDKLFQHVRQTENFTFDLSIVDTGTGRELQNEPVHSLATLGAADGRRPFKALPQPMVFMPRSTVRLQITERSRGARGRVFIALQGYKLLGAAGQLEEAVRRLGEFDPAARIPRYDSETGSYRTMGEVVARDQVNVNVVPFDYVSTLELTGVPGNIVEDEVPINVDGGYTTTALGYSLDVSEFQVKVADPAGNTPGTQTVDLRTLKLTQLRSAQPEPRGAQPLLDGIRIHPIRVRFAFVGGELSSSFPIIMIDRLFQRLNLPEDVRFLFSITDTGTGRELLNQRAHNVASLGIASGDRPFRILHRPMRFLPRSSIRVQVQEIFGRGRLSIVFQGYKTLTPSARAAEGRR